MVTPTQGEQVARRPGDIIRSPSFRVGYESASQPLDPDRYTDDMQQQLYEWGRQLAAAGYSGSLFHHRYKTRPAQAAINALTRANLRGDIR